MLARPGSFPSFLSHLPAAIGRYEMTSQRSVNVAMELLL